MTAVAGGVEGVSRVLPVDLLIRLPSREMSNAAGRRIKPLLPANIKSHGKGLQSPFVQECQKIVNVLPSKDMRDRVSLLAPRPGFLDPTLRSADLGAVTVFANDYILLLGGESGPGQFRRVWLHGHPMPGRRPELVKSFVTLATALRTGIALRGLSRGAPRRPSLRRH